MPPYANIVSWHPIYMSNMGRIYGQKSMCVGQTKLNKEAAGMSGLQINLCDRNSNQRHKSSTIERLIEDHLAGKF